MQINPNICRYIEKNIIPKYTSFDKAHNMEHVLKVINNSLTISVDYNVDINKVYVIAAYHDVGLSQGRENHEKTSSAYLLSDHRLREWFTEDELILMAEAVEDHRASHDYEPRSIYGKIVSEADRDIEYETILKRTILFSLKHHADFDFDQHLTRSYEHICDKYGEGGYLNLWLNTEANRRNLQKLRSMIASKEQFRRDFEKIFMECSK